MRQQQLLLFVLSTIIVGTAIVVDVNMFIESAVNSNRDAVVQDCMILATRAQQWYRTPTILGGGGRSFTGLTLADIRFPASNDNGTFAIVVDNVNQVTVTGTGREPNPANPLTVVMEVMPDSIRKPTITIP